MDAVHLVKVDVVGLEPFEAAFAVFVDLGGVEEIDADCHVRVPLLFKLRLRVNFRTRIGARKTGGPPLNNVSNLVTLLFNKQ